MPTRELSQLAERDHAAHVRAYAKRREAERREAEAYRRHKGIRRLQTRAEAELLDLSLGILGDDQELYDALRPALELLRHRVDRRWRRDA